LTTSCRRECGAPSSQGTQGCKRLLPAALQLAQFSTTVPFLLLPGGRNLLPIGRKLLPTGRKLLPLGRKLLLTGRKLLPLGRKLLPLGRKCKKISTIGRRTIVSEDISMIIFKCCCETRTPADSTFSRNKMKAFQNFKRAQCPRYRR
jgi:hypothetical protein